MLVEAFALAIKDCEDSEWTLDMFGDGDPSEIQNVKKTIAKCGIQDKVIIHTATENIHDEMQQRSIFAMTSDFEGMPNSLMEAMGLGMACISTDCPCGGPKYLIQSGDNGYLVPVNGKNEFAEKLKLLINDETHRKHIAQNALNVRDKLNYNYIFEQWNDYIKSFVTR